MTEDAPIASSISEYNGNVPPEKTRFHVIDIIDEIAKSVGSVPRENAETSSEAPFLKENPEEIKNSLEDSTTCEAPEGKQQCEEKQDENNTTLKKRSADIPSQEARAEQKKSEEGQYEEIIPVSTKECEVNRQEERNAKHPHGRKVEHANKAEKFLPAGAQEMVQILERKLQIKDEMQLKAREKAAGEEDEDVEEEELVQLTENKKVNSEESYLKKQENGREESPPNSPSFNSQAEKPGEQLEIGGKNDVSKHSYSKYNTISYRKIRKGNTKQRIDEFESMMHL
ncbi:PREDICTED: ermin [Crocodylus porosus]|uniref:ermin n=1 Tax=Crocodylus porosus TaxID=8502 RepID=UPI00093B88A0|nr:PREDICTED: ermin [Crocodylus porosus]